MPAAPYHASASTTPGTPLRSQASVDYLGARFTSTDTLTINVSASLHISHAAVAQLAQLQPPVDWQGVVDGALQDSFEALLHRRLPPGLRIGVTINARNGSKEWRVETAPAGDVSAPVRDASPSTVLDLDDYEAL